MVNGVDGHEILNKAVEASNADVVRAFGRHFDFKKGFPIRYRGGDSEGSDFATTLYMDMNSTLDKAIKTSEEMAKLLLQLGVNPLAMSKEYKCDNDPGCQYFKLRLEQAQQEHHNQEKANFEDEIRKVKEAIN